MRFLARDVCVGWSLVALAGLSVGGLAQGVWGASADWPGVGGTGNSHYSELKQIDRANVSKLQVAWSLRRERAVGWRLLRLLWVGCCMRSLLSSRWLRWMGLRGRCFGGLIRGSTGRSRIEG